MFCKKKLIAIATLLLNSFVIMAQQTPTYFIKAGKFYDSEKNVFLKNQELIVTGGKITAVGTGLQVPKNAVVINATDGTVTPGLIDAHTHLLTLQKLTDNLAIDAMMNSGETRVLRGAGMARSFLESGFTAIRDLGNSGYYLDVELKRAIRNKYVPGPKMLVSGPILSAIDGQFFQLPLKEQEKITTSEYRVIKGIEDAKQAVKEHANNFVDVIKIVAFGERLGLSKDEMKAIVETAHELRMKVTAHATADWVVKDAVEAGVDGIEHAYDISDSTIMLLKSRNVYVVPTDPSADVFMRVGEVQKVKDQTLEKVNNELTGIRKRLKKMFDMGLMIVNGSDMYIDLEQSQGDGAKQSIVAYFESGLTAAESLRTATWNAAAALGKTGQYGALKEKHAADLVIFNGDLEKDFKKVLFQVKSVMKDGVVVYTKQ